MKADLSELNKNILNNMLAEIKTLLDAESASLFLFDRERQELVLNSVFNEQKARFKGVRQRIGEGIAGRVADEQKAVLVQDIKTDPRFRRSRLHRYLTDSFICVPLTTQDGLIGVINISDKKTGRIFTEQDLKLACFFSQAASRIIEGEINLIQLKEENNRLKKERLDSKTERVTLEKFASMGKLAGGIVHEINNPLDAVMRYTNILSEKNIEPPLAAEYLKEIKIGLTRIMKITRSLLEFSQQLKDSDRREYACVDETIEEALSLFRHPIAASGIKIEKDCSPSLPRIIDKGLCRVFSNLIKNAIDAMPHGGVLKIAASRVGGNLCISFGDTGCGIPDAIRENIFTPFFTTKPIGQGVGLGLPICFEVVQRYNGEISFESVPGKGTEFKIRLPLDPIVQPA